MINNALRILIADEQHETLLRIERALNRIGYYRVAPVQTFHDLMQLTDIPDYKFDLLIASNSLALPDGVDLITFCEERPNILNALFYDQSSRCFELLVERQDLSIKASLVDIPNAGALRVLMKIIDSLPQEGYQAS